MNFLCISNVFFNKVIPSQQRNIQERRSGKTSEIISPDPHPEYTDVPQSGTSHFEIQAAFERLTRSSYYTPSPTPATLISQRFRAICLFSCVLFHSTVGWWLNASFFSELLGVNGKIDEDRCRRPVSEHFLPQRSVLARLRFARFAQGRPQTSNDHSVSSLFLLSRPFLTGMKGMEGMGANIKPIQRC